MRVIALNFADADFATPGTYREYMLEKVSPLLTADKTALVVLPAHSALLLAWSFGDLGDVQSLDEAVLQFVQLSSWPAAWYEQQQKLARELNIWFIPGTVLVRENGRLYHEAPLLNPQGGICGRQKQLFLTQQEKTWGLARGTSAEVFATPFGTLGIIVGTDAWYPETGRILALSGAGLICHPGAVPEENHTWLQFAGMWSQVQQNQFFCVESQLCTEIAGYRAGGNTLIHAPCEMTAGSSGILARGGQDGGPVVAELDEERRREVISRYPLLKLLQPEAYSPIYPEKGERS